MDVYRTTLSNGVKVLCEPLEHVESAAIGLWCRAGSAHEREDEAGITHFIEHMLFKGTERRTSKQIAEAIEGRGGVLNAFTDKEQTCYYSRVLAEDVEHAVDVLSDMMLNSKLEPEEIQRERGVILEEIKRSEDEPGDHVHDVHLQKRWNGHALGKPVIGTRDSVGGFERESFTRYMNRRYLGGNVMLVAAGKLEPSKFAQVAEEKLVGLGQGGDDPALDRPKGEPMIYEIPWRSEQVHFCIGTDGVSSRDESLYQGVLLDAILGGGMSSRLFQEIREKRGLAYAVGSYNLAYGSGGAFVIFGGTSKESWPTVKQVVREELDKFMDAGADAEELERAKKNLKGRIVLGLESNSSRMMRIAR
ncbi:MAG: M16 family metallopeptidase, partial [Fimbriimonadaceae bacterium]